jgi:hypothetical protein
MKKLLAFSVIILFIGVSITLPTGSISKVTSLYKSNNPPYVPNNPIPADSEFDISICPNLSWSGGDPDGDNVTYDVYIGRDPLNMQLVANNISVPWYQIPFLLDFDTKYFWQVTARDEYGLNTYGPIWNFRTEENLPPYPPSNPDPEDGAYYVLNVSLCWEGGDPNKCDILTYDLYFDDTNPPKQVFCNLTINCWSPPYNLSMYKRYYWKVVSWDSGGLSTSGPTWSFTTGSPPPEVEFVNPREGYFHFFGIPLFQIIFNSSVDSINIGGFKLRPIQVNGTDGGPDGDPIAIWLYINNEDKGFGTWNPETGYYEWQWTGWALGTYVLRARGEDIYGQYSNWTVITIWNFCFLQ